MEHMDKADQGDGWPYVLKPRWVHDLLLLWRRKQPYELYLDQVADYSVREVGDKALRRRCVAWIANHFAPNHAALTAPQNVWASYSHHFRAKEIAAAYLAYLIINEPLARQATAELHGQVTPGLAVGRTRLVNVPAVSGALDAWLRTLQEWGVLVADPRQGGYLVDKRLAVSGPTFPLLVWAWWLDTRAASIPLAEFAELPLWSWLETDAFAAGWQAYVGRLWTLEADGGVSTIFLHPTDDASFMRALLNLLSTDGRRGRQLPRHDEAVDEGSGNQQKASANMLLREGILGR